MRSIFKKVFFFYYISFFLKCDASYHEQYRVPTTCTDKYESYTLGDREFLIQNFPVSWDNAKILCRGHHNATLAVLDSKEKAEFLAEALSESQFAIQSLWVGAKRGSAGDPAGYRWSSGLELRRTALDVYAEKGARHYPAWLNRTLVPVPEGGSDCAALERAGHDRPVFVDLPCPLQRPFACEREARSHSVVSEVRSVRCRTGLYRVYDGRLDWHQAAAYCVIRKMTLANIATLRCLKKLGMTMLKARPSIENAWIGARGSLGRWSWTDSGADIFAAPPYSDAAPGAWPPVRDRSSSLKQSGCLQLDRHAAHAPVFLEARCERRMQFICYQSAPALRTQPALPSDENYYYVLVRQLLFWQHAYENCMKMNGTLASVDNKEILIQLLLVMGENKDEPVDHIWLSGRLNMTKELGSEGVGYIWYNPLRGRRIPDNKSAIPEADAGLFMPPWLEEDFTMDSPCLNLDRQSHLSALVYGLPCDTPQSSICMIEKATNPATQQPEPVLENVTDVLDEVK